ncbi:MAG: ABC transporter permease subunit, partial [Bacilli bacterium]|nr:ABC transporter permease subunit [Bacilli bacterium]
ELDWQFMFNALKETLYMTLMTTIITFFLGLGLGLLLYFSSKREEPIFKLVNVLISQTINILRAIPFIILIILLIPFTRIIVGTILGPNAALPALIIGCVPFYARLVMIGLNEVDKGVIEASKAFGATNLQIITRVLIPEALPAIISGITVTCVQLVGYTALAGAIGAGGLGHLAYMEGFQRGRNQVTLVATLLLLVIVFMIQFIGDYITKKDDKR